MRAHPTLFKSLFVYCEKKMSAGKVTFEIVLHIFSEELKSLFFVRYSEEGHNRRPAELQAWVNFCDFLDGCEGAYCNHI